MTSELTIGDSGIRRQNRTGKRAKKKMSRNGRREFNFSNRRWGDLQWRYTVCCKPVGVMGKLVIIAGCAYVLAAGFFWK